MTRVPSMSTAAEKMRIVTALFDTREAAERAINALGQAGIDRNATSLTEGNNTEAQETARPGQQSIWDDLKSLFLPDEDQEIYAEGLKRGGFLVSVRVKEAEHSGVVDILDDEGSVDLTEREASWRSSGWSGSGNVAGQAKLTEDTSAGESSGEDVVPLAQESLRVGKRDVEHGRLKVRSYVVEEPVSEDVSLRRERVSLDRRQVDRPVASGSDPFQERTVEVTEHAEEAVVSKDVRIREELVLRKDADQRTETISDTVRRTEVEVELKDEMGEKRIGNSSRARNAS
jgi:uncharacterized protein (TIGR02271 family)